MENGIRRCPASVKKRRCVMPAALLLSTLALMVPALLPDPAWAYRDYLTVEQKAQLEKIQTVLVEAIALTDKGTGDAAPITDVAARRMGELGYTVVRDASKPHDATFKVKCEQRKTDRKSTRLNSSHPSISYAVFCLKKKMYS